MIEILRYTPEHQSRWDQFVRSAKNGHFMFERNYMDYHAHRFDDHSLLFLMRGRLIGVLPAHWKKGCEDEKGADSLSSHEGLPFAGIVSGPGMRATFMEEIVEALLDYLRAIGAVEFRYRATPRIYHRHPADEDIITLVRAGAVLVESKLTLARLAGECGVREHKSRRQHARSARESGIEVRPLSDIGKFHDLLSRWLRERHGADPVHTREELELLGNRFPDQIRAFGAFLEGELLAAELIFESEICYRLQYAANTVKGIEMHAFDAIWDFLFSRCFEHGKWVDFGTSLIPENREIDWGLVEYKESIGARAISQNSYLLSLS